MRRARIAESHDTPSATDAAHGVDILNDMVKSWETNGVYGLSQGFVLDDTFALFVPPEPLDSETSQTTTMDYLVYKGAWDALANSPVLASGSGTRGDVYKVTVAGSTVLDDVSSWSLNDWLVFNGTEWLKGKPIDRHIQAVVALLAVELAGDFGLGVTPAVAKAANDGWDSILADYLKSVASTFDPAITRLPSRRWPYSTPSSN